MRQLISLLISIFCLVVFVRPQPVDECPNDPNKLRGKRCGCGVPETDSDDDGTPDCIDVCPQDPIHTNKVGCGCGEPETDSDGDGTPDCKDVCPQDSTKGRYEGSCGCGVPEIDTDEDGRPNCVDECPLDPWKQDDGQCGCGVPDTDSDGDGVADCNDQCPFSDVSSAYCGTFMPCMDLECIKESAACEEESEDCGTALQWHRSGSCEGLAVTECWQTAAALTGFPTDGFRTVFECFENCKRLGQCETHDDCQNAGTCYSAAYGAKFCKCSDEWLGWDCSIPTAFNNVLQVDAATGEVNLYFAWTLTDDYVYFQWKCRGSVWCAVQIGATDDNVMINAYPIAGTVKGDGTVFMADTVSNGEPTDDVDAGGTYDLEDISGWMDGEFEVFRCKVKTDTGDIFDWVYRPNERSKASWAYGALPLDRGMDYHGLGNRQLIYIDFTAGVEDAYHIPEPPTEPFYALDLPDYACSAILQNAPFQLFWTISADQTTIDIAFGGSIPSGYWLGFALAPGIVMEGGDAVIAIKNGMVRQYDLVGSPRNAVSEPDFRNDISNTLVEEIDGFTVMKFTRPIDTGDDTDMVISLENPMNILWASGPDPTPNPNGHDRRDAAEIHFGICDGGGIDVPQHSPTPSPPPVTNEPVETTYILIWTSGRTYDDIILHPGETVTFDYYPGAHNVHEFDSEEMYNNCDFSNSVLLSDVNSPPYIFEATIDQVGTVMYIGCSIADHCVSGQKVVITIVAEGTAAPLTEPPETEVPTEAPDEGEHLDNCGTIQIQKTGAVVDVNWKLSTDRSEIRFELSINESDNVYVSFGFQNAGSLGDQMIGADAVVFQPSDNSILEYNLMSKASTAGNIMQENQDIRDVIWGQDGTITTFGFTRDVNLPSAAHGQNIDIDGTQIVIWAIGIGDSFGFHMRRDEYELSLGDCGDVVGTEPPIEDEGEGGREGEGEGKSEGESEGKSEGEGESEDDGEDEGETGDAEIEISTSVNWSNREGAAASYGLDGSSYDVVVLYAGQGLGLIYNSEHDVYEFPGRYAYRDCDFTNAVERANANESSYIFPVYPSAECDDVYYFGCSTSDHCSEFGQKIAVIPLPNDRCKVVVWDTLGFEEVIPGVQQFFAWISSGEFMVDLLLWHTTWKFPRYIASDVPSDYGYTWLIPEDIEPLDDFQIEIREHQSRISEFSDTFNVFDVCVQKNCGVHSDGCVNGICQCIDDYQGPMCNISPCDQMECHQEGTDLCEDGECQCLDGWSGDFCEHFSDCSPCVHGYTNRDCSSCTCFNDAWTGDACDQCTIECDNDGVPDETCQYCDCLDGFFGSDCSRRYNNVKTRLLVSFEDVVDGQTGEIEVNFEETFESDVSLSLEVSQDQIFVTVVIESPQVEKLVLLQEDNDQEEFGTIVEFELRESTEGDTAEENVNDLTDRFVDLLKNETSILYERPITAMLDHEFVEIEELAAPQTPPATDTEKPREDVVVESPTGGGEEDSFPWWGILIIVVVIASCIMICMICCCLKKRRPKRQMLGAPPPAPAAVEMEVGAQ